MYSFRNFTGAVVALGLSVCSAFAADSTVRVGVLEIGTVNWELDTIKHYGLDSANGFSMEVQGFAGNPATQIAFQGGEVDVIVSDLLWVARQRAEGKDFMFIPYSKAVGAMMVPASSEAQTLKDLTGGKIGIAGGPLDKSWLILRAYAQQEYGMDLAAETEQVFGAPPLIFKTAVSGDVAGGVNFWHFQAKMEAAGMRQLIDVDTAARALGLDPDTPLLGYVVKGEMLRENPEIVNGLVQASRQAKELLASDPAAFDRLRDRMRAANDAEFDALKAGFIAGIPATDPIDAAAAGAMMKLMTELGGEELTGGVTELPEGLMVAGGS